MTVKLDVKPDEDMAILHEAKAILEKAIEELPEDSTGPGRWKVELHDGDEPPALWLIYEAWRPDKSKLGDNEEEEEEEEDEWEWREDEPWTIWGGDSLLKKVEGLVEVVDGYMESYQKERIYRGWLTKGEIVRDAAILVPIRK